MTDYSYIKLKPIQELETGDILLASKPHERWGGLCPYGVVEYVSSLDETYAGFTTRISQISLLKNRPDRLWVWGLIIHFENPRFDSFLDSRNTLNGNENNIGSDWKVYINFHISNRIFDKKHFFIPILKT